MSIKIHELVLKVIGLQEISAVYTPGGVEVYAL